MSVTSAVGWAPSAVPADEEEAIRRACTAPRRAAPRQGPARGEPCRHMTPARAYMHDDQLNQLYRTDQLYTGGTEPEYYRTAYHVMMTYLSAA